MTENKLSITLNNDGLYELTLNGELHGVFHNKDAVFDYLQEELSPAKNGKHREKNKKYYEKHKPQCIAYIRKWQKENRDKVLSIKKRHREKNKLKKQIKLLANNDIA